MKINVCMLGYSNYLTDVRIRREAEALAELPEYTVHMLTLKEDKKAPRSFIHNGVHVRELNIRKYRGKSNLRYILSYVKFTFLASWACNKLLFKKSLDVVHVHNMPNFLIFAAILPLSVGKKAVLDIHDTMIETYSSKFHGKFNRFLGRALLAEEYLCCFLADRIVCVNDVQKAALVGRRIPENKITISMNVPDPKRLKCRLFPPKQQRRVSFNLVYFGTIANRLGVDLAIRAVAKLDGQIPSLKFFIIGDGDDKEECIQLCNTLGMQGKIIFEEGKMFEELLERLKEMDIVVVPNRKNSATQLMLPVKMLDGVTLGLPIIAPKLRAIQHYFSDGMIFFFEPDDVDSLTETILFSYNNEGERRRKAEKAMVFLDRYGWEKHKVDYLNMYESLYENNGRRTRRQK